MKTFRVEGGYTVHESYETYIKANNQKEAEEKALKKPVENWDELQSFNDGGFIVDSVEEWEDE
jgi:hypothetical protein